MALWRPAGVAMLVSVLSLPVVAADLSYSVPGGQCTFAEQSQLYLLPEDEIEVRVAGYYDETAAALKSEAVIGSRSPAFLWASEAKFQCGKAIGYLKGGSIDEESVQKCDCFYGRYLKFR
jgi:hypothetical protein